MGNNNSDNGGTLISPLKVLKVPNGSKVLTTRWFLHNDFYAIAILFLSILTMWRTINFHYDGAGGSPATTTTTTTTTIPTDEYNNVAIMSIQKKKKKKFVAVHIGPAKTGTTTIQKESVGNPDFVEALKSDGVLYVGRYSNQKAFKRAMECSKEVIRLSTSSSFEGKQPNVKKKCWGKEKQRRYVESSLIMSDEAYSFNADRFLNRDIPDLQKIFIDYLGYDEIIIVGAYRRYGEWIASVYKQRNKVKCLHQHDDMCENIWEFTKKWIPSQNYGARSARQKYSNLDEILRPLITHEGETAAAATNLEMAIATNTSNISNIKQPKFMFDVLNYFQLPNEKYYRSITSELYCKSLGNRTPNACRYSKHERSETEASVIQNKGSLDTFMYHDIFVEAKNRGWIHNITYYHDNTAEESSGRRERIVQVAELVQYHTGKLGLNVMENLPLLCPSRSELQLLLDKSLRFEELIMPGFFSTKLGKEEHIRTFWEFVNEGKSYCWLDIKRLFQNASSWHDLLTNRMVIDVW